MCKNRQWHGDGCDPGDGPTEPIGLDDELDYDPESWAVPGIMFAMSLAYFLLCYFGIIS